MALLAAVDPLENSMAFVALGNVGTLSAKMESLTGKSGGVTTSEMGESIAAMMPPSCPVIHKDLASRCY